LSRERGRPGQNLEVERQLQELCSMIVDMGVKQRRKADVGDTSESEDKGDARQGAGEIPAEDAANERLMKAIAQMSSKKKMDIPTYEGNIDEEELLDWIRALDTYFDYEDIEEDKKVKHAVMKLKGHATLLWDGLQADRRWKGK
jgi:hypothetical protein